MVDKPEPKVEHGKVIKYNKATKIGKLEVDYETIYFRLNFARPCRVVKEVLEFSKWKPDHIEWWIPKVGDSVVFIRSKGKMGRPRAFPWDLESNEIEAWEIYEEEKLPCPDCGHLNSEHTGGVCQHLGCHCGDEAYSQDDEPRVVSTQDSPGGFVICE